MANSKSSGVYYVDTTDTTISGPLYVSGIKFIGAQDGSAVIKDRSTTGAVLWEESGTTNVFNDVCFRAKSDIHITLAGGAKVIIYTK